MAVLTASNIPPYCIVHVLDIHNSEVLFQRVEGAHGEIPFRSTNETGQSFIKSWPKAATTWDAAVFDEEKQAKDDHNYQNYEKEYNEEIICPTCRTTNHEGSTYCVCGTSLKLINDPTEHPDHKDAVIK